jgi:hypothetical protein
MSRNNNTAKVTLTYRYEAGADRQTNQFKHEMVNYQKTDEFKNKMHAIGKQLAATKVGNNWEKNSQLKVK